jgi:hypothetical protein
MESTHVDYKEVFTPVVKWTTVRTVVALAASKHWDIFQNDIKTTFLNGVIGNVDYMRQPEGFVKPKEEGKVWLLNRALYGLKQSQRVWNETMKKELKEMNFEQSRADPCLYLKKAEEKMTIVLLHEDDLFVTGDLDVQG